MCFSLLILYCFGPFLFIYWNHIISALDRYAECRRFIVQDEEQLVGVCVDVHGVIYDDDDGSIALEVAYCKPAQAEMTPEVLTAFLLL